MSTGREEERALLGELGKLDDAAFCGVGSLALARLGGRGDKDGWFLPGASQPSTIPADSFVACSPDGSEIAYSDLEAHERKIFVGARGNYKNYSLAGSLTAASFSSDGEVLYYLTLGKDGESTLFRVRVRTGESQIIADHLDASRIVGSIALSLDGKYAYLALASDGAPNDELRNTPNVDRWLKIYQVNLATGARHVIVDSPGQDNTGPVIANGNLYWTRTVLHDSIVTLKLPLLLGSRPRMTPIQRISLLVSLGAPIFSFAASVPQTILPDNLIVCQVKVNCTNKLLYGRTYKVINTPRFTVMVAVSREGAYTRADVSIANNAIIPQTITPEDFRVEVVTPKPKVLLYVHPTDASAPLAGTVAPAAPASQPADASHAPKIDQLYPEAKQKAARKEEADEAASQRDLSATSLPPNEVALGRVFFERDKHAQLVNVVLPIAGLVFEFPYTMK